MELQHRFISIQKVTQTLIETPSQWEQLLPFVTAQDGITSSNAVNKIVSLVRSEIISWNVILNKLTDLSLTLSGVLLDNVITGITDVLIYQVETQTDSSSEFKYPFSVKTGLNRRIHPFILIISTKSNESWLYLFAQIERIFDVSRLELIKSKTSEKKSAFLRNMLEMIRPFLDFVFLDRSQRKNEQWSFALIHFLIRIVFQGVDDKDFDESRECTLKYLLSVVQRISLTPIISHYIASGTVYVLMQSLVNIMSVTYLRNSFTPSFSKEFSNILGIQILSIACDAHQSNLPTSHYVALLFKLSKLHYESPNRISLPSFILLWPSLTFLLLNTHSCESQSLILKIMKEVIENKLNESDKQDVNPELINVAILPMFQIMSDLTQDETRNIAMEIILNIQNLHNLQSSSNKKSLEEVYKFISSRFIVGNLAEILSETHNLLKSFPLSDVFRIDDVKSPFFPLFHIPYLFHKKENVQIQALNEIISIINDNISLAQSQKFPIFLLILFILRNDDLSSIHPHILHQSLPSLISPKDPIITAKVLKITMSLVQVDRETRLKAVGIRVLYKLWERQRRCWKSLRFILGEWVKNRKLNNSRIINDDVKGERFEVEVAALTTIRDICKSKARDYAEEVIPFMSSLLQSVILHPNSLCLIIESLNLCVEAKVIDSRAVWTVLMSYVADAIMQSKHLNVRLIARLCQFYRLVAQNEDTDVYNEFKQDILSVYLCPLIFPNYRSKFSLNQEQQEEICINDSVIFQIQSNTQILKHGLKAITLFSVTEILFEFFPESPKILLDQIFNNKGLVKIEEWRLLLSKFVSYEIDSMRRGVFKGITGRAGSKSSIILESENFLKVKQRLTLIGSEIVDDWESGRLNPGLRVGIALASLRCFKPPINEESENELVKHDIHVESSRFYKLLTNAIQDISLTDHWIIRVGCVAEWNNFFVMGLQEVLSKTNEPSDGENIVKSLMEDLMKRLIDARFPAVFQNVILAITGLCLALKSLNIPSAQAHVTKFLHHLLENFLVDAALVSNQRDSSLMTSDEVQFGVMMALGHLSTLIMMNEMLLESAVNTLVTKLCEVDESDMSGWTLFGTGYALGFLISCIASSPTKTSEMENICSQTINFLNDFLSSPLLSVNHSNTPQINSAFGVLLGLSNIDHEYKEAIGQIYQKCLLDLKEFVNTEGRIDENIKSTIAGSAWLVGFSKGLDPNEEIVEIFKKATQIASNEREWTEYYFHFSQTYSHILQNALSIKQSSFNLSAFNTQVHSQIQILTSSGLNIVKHHAAIITLGSLLGVHYFSSTQTTNSYFFTSSSLTMVTQVLDTLQNIAGLGQQQSLTSNIMMNDVKGGRLATIVLSCLVQIVERISEIGNEFTRISSTEPRDYSRLPAKSYLRILFDNLVEVSQRNDAGSPIPIEAGSLIINIFSDVNMILPPVDWFPPFTRFNTPFFETYDLHYQCVLMATRHCDYSTSLMEFLIYVLMKFPKILHERGDETYKMEYKKLLVNKGLCKILELYGFVKNKAKVDDQKDTKVIRKRGIENMAKKVVVPDSRVYEIVSGMVKSLFDDIEKRVDPKIEELQIDFLTIMSDYMSSDNASYAESLNTLRQELLVLLRNVYHGIPPPTSKTQVYITRLATQTCIFTIDDLDHFPSTFRPKDNFKLDENELKKYAVTISTMSELGRVDAIIYLTRALEDCLSTFGIISIAEGFKSVDLVFSWILHAIRNHIFKPMGSSNNAKKKMKLDWLVRTLNAILVVTGISREGQFLLDYGIKVALNGLVNLSWEEYQFPNQVKYTDKVLPLKYYELQDERFEKVMQNVDVKKVASLIPREFENSPDNEIDIVQTQIIKRLLKLFELSKEISTIDHEHHFILYSILVRLEEYIPNEEIWTLLDDDLSNYKIFPGLIWKEKSGSNPNRKRLVKGNLHPAEFPLFHPKMNLIGYLKVTGSKPPKMSAKYEIEIVA
ncbi:14383_t:CDS:10 [Funneliformis geosporum]|uniref:1964_t:CDS:1 n=1 Tax=Funneliformis geosporum TaxID=1117311 RepID=A0A9W4SDL6_9GLOM|nr:14383_t:CDS:10 [Funneliformis geosporum]CAI2165827.1 1964_t:CDS:10 [Funneliformis geosporum]